jgi:ketosteroid isomerase-like protein
MSDADAMKALATKFFDSIESGDDDKLHELYAPDAKIWHNTDGLEQTPTENVEQLRGFTTRIDDRVYADRRIEVFPNGFVHQHVLRGTRNLDGVRVELPACLVCEVQDGRITLLEEYFDSAHVAQLTKRA